MTIIVEDGSIVPNSNSYTDLANARVVAASLRIIFTGR